MVQSDKAILILSGGLDSAVSACLAARHLSPCLALTFDYGQRAARKEAEAAATMAAHLEVPHKVFPLPWLAELTSTGLVNRDRALPHPRREALDDPTEGRLTAEAVWVPNRNGLFLNIAACFAESLGASWLVTGFNAEEAATFPDNGAPFVESADRFFSFATARGVRVTSYTLNMNKAEIMAKGRELGVPLEALWSCYEAGPRPCQKCESCLRLERALQNSPL